jgi:hypothetical protein
VTNAGTEKDTGASLSVNWQATYKLQASLGYTYTYRDYPGQGTNPLGSDRVDHEQHASLSFQYRPQRWLTIRPYANVQTRSSDVAGDFSSTIFGVYVTVLTPQKGK